MIVESGNAIGLDGAGMKFSIGSSPGSWLEVVPNAEDVKYLTRSACTLS
jgi:hypothetical protein